jgi:uncharacterized protein YukE
MGYADGTFDLDKELSSIKKIAQKIAKKTGQDVTSGIENVEKGIKIVVGSYPDLNNIDNTLISAQDPISYASDYIGQTKNDLPNAWQGSASQAYSGWLTTAQSFTDTLSKTIKDTSSKSGIAYQIQQLEEAIVTIYNSFIDMVTQCCVNVEKALGYATADLADATGGTFDLDPDKVGDATADMIKDATNAMVGMQNLYFKFMETLLTTWNSVVSSVQDIVSDSNTLHAIVAPFA